VNPPRNRKGESDNPSPSYPRAQFLSQQARYAPSLYPTTEAGPLSLFSLKSGFYCVLRGPDHRISVKLSLEPPLRQLLTCCDNGGEAKFLLQGR
jgi:hypothetical protein